MGRGGKRLGAGKPKGSKASHTLEAQAAKLQLIEAYKANATEINDALVKKAKTGDIMAIKELHDRVFGRAFQSGELDLTSAGESIQITNEQYQQAITAAIKRSSSDQSSEGGVS